MAWVVKETWYGSFIEGPCPARRNVWIFETKELAWKKVDSILSGNAFTAIHTDTDGTIDNSRIRTVVATIREEEEWDPRDYTVCIEMFAAVTKVREEYGHERTIFNAYDPL